MRSGGTDTQISKLDASLLCPFLRNSTNATGECDLVGIFLFLTCRRVKCFLGKGNEMRNKTYV
jgi:hypothetical protein